MYRDDVKRFFGLEEGSPLLEAECKTRAHLNLMSERGFRVSVPKIDQRIAKMDVDLVKMETQVYQLSGGIITKPNSARQVQTYLESRGMSLPTTRSGNPSGSAEALLSLMGRDEIIPIINDYRSLLSRTSAMKSVRKTVLYDRCHPTFDTLTCETGRIYSRDPNVMGWSSEIVECIEPDDGYRILTVDYKAQELRILAGLSGCENLMKAFLTGGDPHLETAKLIFSTDFPTKEQRSIGKTFNFATLYGQTVGGLAKKLHVSKDEAQYLQDCYFKAYPEILSFRRWAEKKAQETGYTSTYYGRKRPLTFPKGDSQAYETALRQAVNTWIQGTAADILKFVLASLPPVSDKFDVLFPVHDSLYLQVREDVNFSEFKAYIEEKMVRPFRGVLLEVEWK